MTRGESEVEFYDGIIEDRVLGLRLITCPAFNTVQGWRLNMQELRQV